MIARNDVVLALSNSGETPELSAIISFTRRYELPLIGILSKRDSALGEAADIVLTLPSVAEACPMGLAPKIRVRYGESSLMVTSAATWTKIYSNRPPNMS
jgi:D-arabinose 5-phosphate isomerase GutQ